MAKLPNTVTEEYTPIPEESEAIKGEMNKQNFGKATSVVEMSHEETMEMIREKGAKRKRDFVVAYPEELYKIYPQFFKLVPDYAKIRAAIKLGIPTPGVQILDPVLKVNGGPIHSIGGGDEENAQE